MRTERNGKTRAAAANRIIRFPTDEEINEFLDEALPIAQKQAEKHDLDIENWMIAEAICQICPEIKHCSQQRLEEAVNRVIKSKQLSHH